MCNLTISDHICDRRNASSLAINSFCSFAQMATVPKRLGRLLEGGIINSIPKWYPIVKKLPPAQCQPRGPCTNNPVTTSHLPFEYPRASSASTSSPSLPRSRHQIKHLRKKSQRPQAIVYPEDKLRKRFYEKFPFELARPVCLAEDQAPSQKDLDGYPTLDWSQNPTTKNLSGER
jgi:hypothetical protein